MTGMNLRIAAGVALDRISAGASPTEVAPVWLAIAPESALAQKLPGGGSRIQHLRSRQGNARLKLPGETFRGELRPATPARGMTAFTAEDAYVDAPGHRIGIRRYLPEIEGPAAAPAPTLVWLHGGGFFRGTIDQPEADAVARALASRGLPVVTVSYRLAPFPLVGRLAPRGRSPRGRFPFASDDVVAVLRHVQRESPQRLLLGGASAGACLAAGVAVRMRDLGSAPALDGVVLAYGFFHARHPRDAEIQRRVRGRRRLTHAPRMLDAANLNYAGSRRALAERSAFPGGHDLRGFPAAIVVDADRDAMRASSGKFAAELTAAGVDVERQVLPEVSHAFLNRPQRPEFAIAIDRIARWALARRPS